MAVTETDLERIVESLRRAPETPQEALAWSKRAVSDLTELVELARGHFAQSGGSFGARLRESVEERILQQLNGRAELTDDTKIHSLGVHVLPGNVVVDVRLNVGRWQQ